MTEIVLSHHGIKGMKWGVRRSERQLSAVRGPKKSSAKKKGGLFKAKTKKTVAKSTTQEPKKPSLSEMSDSDLEKAVRRLNLEKQYRDLNPQKVSLGRRFANSVMKDVVKPAAADIGKKLMKVAMTNAINAIAKQELITAGDEKKKKS